MMCHGRTNDLRSTSFGGHVELYAAYQQQFADIQAQALFFSCGHGTLQEALSVRLLVCAVQVEPCKNACFLLWTRYL